MKPYKYTVGKNGKITYHYTFSELREFLSYGFKNGNNAWILTSQEGVFYKYRGFGTIESPIYSLRTINIENDSFYSGEMADPEKVVNPPGKTDSLTKSYRMVIWDVREYIQK